MLAGHRPKLWVGEKDAGKLGIIRFRPEGREFNKKKRKGGVRKLDGKNTIIRAGQRHRTQSSNHSQQTEECGTQTQDGQGGAPYNQLKGHPRPEPEQEPVCSSREEGRSKWTPRC